MVEHKRTAFPVVQRRILMLVLFFLATPPRPDLMAQDHGEKSAVTADRAHVRALSASTRRALFDRIAFFGQSSALPRWDNGYLVSREVETYRPGAANVRLFDSSGQMIREAAIWFPGSQRVVIYSASVTPDGKIIAAGDAQKSDGTTATFIALTDLEGRLATVIQTKGFAPATVCQAPDGTVWSFGGTGYDDHAQPNPGDTLRRFDFQKGEIASYLPRSAFAKRPGPEAHAYIRCSAGEVVAYSARAEAYVEMKYGGTAPKVYRVQQPLGLQMVGFALTGPKKIYASFSRAGKSGLYFLSFDGGAGRATWLPVEGTVGAHTSPGVITGLWGADGESLIVSRAEDSAGEAALHWVTPLN